MNEAAEAVKPDRTRSMRAAGYALGALAASIALYAGWRGYQSPDLLLRVASAFGLC